MKVPCPLCSNMIPIRIERCEHGGDHWHNYLICICLDSFFMFDMGKMVDATKRNMFGVPYDLRA